MSLLPNDQIPVFVGDLEEVRSALDAGLQLAFIKDLEQAAVALSHKPRQSRLVQHMEVALQILNGYLDESSGE